jgi:hypothetical protein
MFNKQRRIRDLTKQSNYWNPQDLVDFEPVHVVESIKTDIISEWRYCRDLKRNL